MSYTTVKLGEICTIYSGGTPSRAKPEYWGGSIPWVKISDMLQGEIITTDERITAEGLQNSSAKIIPKETLLLSIFATVGRVALLKIDASTNQAIVGIEIKDESVVDKNYLKFILQSKTEELKSQSRGVAQTNINISILKTLEILLPPLKEQQRIASILDKAELIKRKRALAIEKLAELVQSVFIEMFGDPIKNEKSWKIVKLSQLAYKLGSGSTPTGGDASYKDFGISLIRSLNVHNGKFKYKNLAYIDDVQAKKLSNVSVESGDILLNITGASVARVCIVPKDILPARVNQHVMIIRPKEIVNNIFLEKLLLTKQMQNKLLGISSSGATRESITKSQAEELEIILPEINLQNKFSTIMMEMERLALKENFGENKIVSLLNSIKSQLFLDGHKK